MWVTVWMDGWQLECCGTPFRVGDTVGWTLSDTPDLDWLENAVGPETAHAIDFSEEHHGGVPEDTPVTRGRVIRIRAVRSRFAAVSEHRPSAQYPVPGSAVLTDMVSARGWESESGGLTFNGYVVDLDLPDSSGHRLTDPHRRGRRDVPRGTM